MFYLTRMTRNIIVGCEDLGVMFRRKVETYLRRAVEGQEVQPFGLVIAVVDIFNGDGMTGKVLDDGRVKVVVEYEALVFRLNKDEIVDAIVERVTPEGIFCEVGPAIVHVPRSKIPDSYGYDATTTMVARYVTNDVAAAAGPLGRKNNGNRLANNNDDPFGAAGDDNDDDNGNNLLGGAGAAKAIAPGHVVRVKVLAEVVRSKDFAFRAVCSMKEDNDFLGPI